MPTGYTYSIATPGYPMLMGRMTIGASNGAFTANTIAKTITAGGYYHYHPTAAQSLITEIQTRCQTVGALAGFLVSMDFPTGKTTWDNTAGGVDAGLVFSSALIGYLGLTSTTLTVPAGQTVTSTNQCRGLWLPGKQPADMRGPPGAGGASITDGVTTESTDGSTKTTWSTELAEQEIEWRYLAPGLVWQASESPTNASYQRFWRDILRGGASVRYIPDTSAPASGSNYSPRDPTPEAVGAEREAENMDTDWRIRLHLLTTAS